MWSVDQVVVRGDEMEVLSRTKRDDGDGGRLRSCEHQERT